MKIFKCIFFLSVFLIAMTIVPDIANAGLESSLVGLKMKLTGVILPLLSVIGIAIAALSLFTGNPSITNKGSEREVMELFPLIRILTPPPG